MHPNILQLQQLNGLDTGNMLHSDHAGCNMLSFVADKMAAQLAKYVIDYYYYYLFLSRHPYPGQLTIVTTYHIIFTYNYIIFLHTITHLNSWSGTGAGIADELLSSLNQYGITADILRERLLGFATDGAASMLGKYKGAASIQREQINNDLIEIHCMNHNLELAVHDAVRTVKEASHFQLLIDSLYSFFSLSPKNQRQLEAVAAELCVHIHKVGRVFDVRWLSSSCTSVTALWESYPALVTFFRNGSTDISRSSQDKAECGGLLGKMTNWLFVMEVATMKDALETLKALSLFLQNRNSTVITVKPEIDVALKALRAMKD
ncbi:E3 SUMO-protein ligase KIAA1586-like [Huso huso]|uniref:E3 SUMO-protein ligase KIAA1586-like n=1 Tax=Huso huso TaxID=61971 RepID=A0ABR0Y9G8_HUSHU